MFSVHRFSISLAFLLECLALPNIAYGQALQPDQRLDRSLPPVMKFCAYHCFTFTLENGIYTNYDKVSGEPGEKRILTIESFKKESVIFHRTDYGNNQNSAVMTGRISEDGNSLVDGIIKWQDNKTFSFQMTWGTKLSALPGSDSQRVGWNPQQPSISENSLPPNLPSKKAMSGQRSLATVCADAHSYIQSISNDVFGTTYDQYIRDQDKQDLEYKSELKATYTAEISKGTPLGDSNAALAESTLLTLTGDSIMLGEHSTEPGAEKAREKVISQLDQLDNISKCLEKTEGQKKQVSAKRKNIVNNTKSSGFSSIGLPNDRSANATIDAGFIRWSTAWMVDRYIPGSARIADRALKGNWYMIRGTFDFARFGTKLTIPFAAEFVKSKDNFKLANLCYNDTTSGMTDCINPTNNSDIQLAQSRQFFNSIIVLGLIDAMSSTYHDDICVRETWLSTEYYHCH